MKRNLIYFLAAILIIIVLRGLLFEKGNDEDENMLYGKTIIGVITSYETSEDGVVATVEQHEGKIVIRVIFTEDTMYMGTGIEEAIKNKITGIKVSIRSEYKTIENEIYPVTAVEYK